MKTTNSAGSSNEGSGDDRTVTSLLRQLIAEARMWQNDAQRLMAAGDINTALVFFQNALAKAQAAGESELEAELHNSVGCMLSKLGDKLAAKAHYAAAVAILERIYEPGPKEPELLFFSRYNMQEAQRQIHAQAVNKMLKEATHQLLGGCVHAARNILQEALPFAEHGAKDPRLEAELLNQLAWTYAKEMGKDKKEENLVTAVSILKRAVALVEPYERHDETADKLARILERNLEHFQEVLKERPVWSLIEEADAFLITNVYEHAEAAATKAAAICRKKLGADHHAMAYALNRIGFCQLMMQDFEAARKNLRAAKVIISKWPDHADEARTIGFSLMWAESEKRGTGEWGVVPPEWQ
jgi:tetratricopeptide (TPR) repeat protein